MKQKIKVLLIVICFFILLVGCKRNDDLSKENDIEEPNDNIVEERPVDIIEEKLKSLNLEEKIGQLVVVGFDGTEINEEIVSLIEKYKVGGFILFSRNIVDEYQTLNLLNEIKKINSKNNIPLFLSIDEEGGKVSRLPSSYPKLPEAIKLGEKNDKNISYEFGNILGKRVKSLGLNMNFSPVLDINSNPKNPVIGSRAFGAYVDSVLNNGIQVMQGIKDVNIISVVKHFPGHGDTLVDSHLNLPIVNKNIDELKDFELIPFIEAIENDVDAIMIAHILYQKIDNYPATMSYKIITELLRQQLGFSGVIISDDMTMGAIIENYTVEEGVVSFLKAGGDLVLICHGRENPPKVIDKIKNAVDTGELSEGEIDEKVYRILKLKDKYNLKDNIIDDIEIEELNNITLELIKKIKN